MAIYNFEDKKPKNKKDYQKIIGIVTVSVSILALFCLMQISQGVAINTQTFSQGIFLSS